MIRLEKILEAIGKRQSLRSEETNALRLVDGSGDGISGLIIDDFAGRWLAQSSYSLGPLRGANLGYNALYWKLSTRKDRPVHLAGQLVEEPFLVRECGLQFEVNFHAGNSPGLFLDQRLNRSRLRALARGRTVLNTFAYTCGFGVAAAAGGALTVNLDLSRNYLEWGRRNYRLNRIDPQDHDFIYGDVFDWLSRFKRRDRKFDLIVIDPPTFARNRKSKVFQVRDAYGPLAKLAARCLNPNGLLLCCTNFRRIAIRKLVDLLKRAVERPCAVEVNPMPPDFTGEPYLKSVWLQL